MQGEKTQYSDPSFPNGAEYRNKTLNQQSKAPILIFESGTPIEETKNKQKPQSKDMNLTEKLPKNRKISKGSDLSKNFTREKTLLEELSSGEFTRSEKKNPTLKIRRFQKW